MEKIFVSVLNMSISGSVIIAAVIIMRFLFRRLPRVYSYALWAIPAIRLLCPISVSSVVSLFNFLRPDVSGNRMEYIPSPGRATAAPAAPASPVAPTYPALMEDVVKEAHKSLSFGEIAGIIWAIVALGIVVWAAASYISVRFRVRGSCESGGYFVCENIPSPFVFGIFRPRIYLPAGLSEQDAECIVMHERTHIRRRDHLIKLLTVPILALHWFNPLVWLAIKLMTADMELSCDEQALKNFPTEYKKAYASALLNVSMKQNGITMNGVLGFGESNIKSRIKGVLRMKKPKLWAVLAAVAAAVVLAVCLLTNAVGSPEKPADEALPENQPDVGFDGENNGSGAEFEDIINRYIFFEQIYTVDSLSFGSINGPEDREIGPDDGITVNGDLYYPVDQEGFTEWQQLEGFMHGLFTDDLADAYLSDGRYIDHDGKTFSLMAGGGGWYVSPEYVYGTEELENGRLRLDFYREWDSDEVGEYYTVKLILEDTPDGYRIAEASNDHITDYDSYDWLAPVNRFVQREFYFDPDFSGRHDAEDAGESIISQIAHTVNVTFRYTSDGEFVDAFTDGRGEQVDEIYALDENRLLVYDWDLIAREQIYLLNFETGEAEPILPDTAFGFSYNDYYDITGKWETIEWVSTPRISPDGTKILYESNKYAEDGRPVYRLGLWVFDIQSGAEERIARPEEADPSHVTADYRWTEDGRVTFSCYSADGEYFLDYIYDPATKETAPVMTADSVKNVARDFDGVSISVDIPVRWQSYTVEDYGLQHVGIQIYDGEIPEQREMYGGKLFIASAASGRAQSYIESQEELGISYDVSDYTTALGYKMKLFYRDGVLDYAAFDDFAGMCIFFDLGEQDDMSVIFRIIDSIYLSEGGGSSAQATSRDGAEDITSDITNEAGTDEDSLPPADSNIGGLLDEVAPVNEDLRGYVDEMEELLSGWRDEGKFGINKLGFDLSLPRIDIVTATDTDAEALKNELISMGDYSEGFPYYNNSIVVITIGDDFYEGDLPGGSLLPLGAIPPENEYLRGYFDEMEELLGGWRDEGKFGINKLGFDLTLPRIDIVISADPDAEALKNELISMGDYAEDVPYYNEGLIRITIGEHFPDDMR